jgi:hypothetical protein
MAPYSSATPICRGWWGDDLVSLWTLAAILMLLAVGFVAVSDRRGPSPVWLLSGLLWIALGASAVIQGRWQDMQGPFTVGRYLDLLVAASILMVFRALSLPSRPGRIVAGCVLGAMSFSILTGLRIPTEPLGDRPHITRLEIEAFGECMNEQAGPCTLPILPSGWTITLDGRNG